jgi:hypothetical protein
MDLEGGNNDLCEVTTPSCGWMDGGNAQISEVTFIGELRNLSADACTCV